MQPALASHPGQNAFQLLADGIDALLARQVLARQAERSLDLQYYIWHDDRTGRQLAHALLTAADRGVRVRVLLDDVGAAANDAHLLALAAHPNIAIRLFNPIASRNWRGLGLLADFQRTNRRMHNKAFIADGQVAVLGGRNIGDEYFGASQAVAFGDLDVLTFGPVVAEVGKAFALYWEDEAAVSIQGLVGRAPDPAALQALRTALEADIRAQRDSSYVQASLAVLAERMAQKGWQGFWGQARLLYDSPGKIGQAPEQTAGNLITQFGGAMAGSTRELLVVSPYFIPGPEGVDWFRRQVARGVRVTVLTNSLAATDVGAVHSGYQRYREDLLKAGVRLYEMRPEGAPETRRKQHGLGSSRASLHAKTFISDRRTVFIGSLNLDPRSLRLNTEIGLLCDSPALAEAIAGGIEARLDEIAWRVVLEPDEQGVFRLAWVERGEAGERRHHSEPEASGLRQFGVWFLGLLPIESLL